jgi:hypothetical protein
MKIMFRTIKIEDDGSVGIPCYESNDYRWLVWSEGESAPDILIRHSRLKMDYAYSEFTYPDDIGGVGHREVTVYEMVCCVSENPYFLLVWWGLDEFDCLYHSVALPYNMFSLFAFFNKHFSNNSAKKYCFGEQS